MKITKWYSDLHKEVPALSKTAVLNGLNTLLEAGLIRVVNFENKEARYDFDVMDHEHLKCNFCGTIYGFNINLGSVNADELRVFKITDKNAYFKGTCSRCLLDKK